ncbi:MAG: hypothetical protein KY462_07750 [Actinobacteria bacterium]|nr:hypothetical protein [Actinomycetota bacterium]
MARPPGTLDTPHFALLGRLARRMAGGHVPDEVRRIVDVLTAAADPGRADRLAVRPGEPAILVERLAVWALRRTTEEAVADATRVLDGADACERETQHEDESAQHRYPVAVQLIPTSRHTLSADDRRTV